MMGTAPRNILHRLGDAFQALKATPNPSTLYPTRQSVQGGFLTFPGWDYLQQNQQQGQDEKNAKLATASPWVFRDISAIAREASVATLDVKQRASGADEDIENHPLEVLWENPNPFMGRAWLLQWWIWQLLLYGEAYLYIVTDATGQPAEIWPLPSLYLTPVPDDKKFIAAYLWKKPGASAGIRIDTRPVVYSRLPNPFDIRRGLSPLCAALIEIEGDQAMARWNKNFFSKENATPTGLIAMPKDSLDADVARVRMEIAEFFGGNGTRRVAVARAGDLAWTPFDRSQKDMEFLNARTFNQKLIDTIFGIPEGFWSKDATRANSEGAKATMIENAVWPHLVMLAEDLNAQLLPAYYEAGLRAEFADIRPRNRQIELEEIKTYQLFTTVNELRKRVDMDELDDPRGLMFVSEVNKGTPIPATPAGEMTEAYIAEQEAAVEEEMPAEDEGALPAEEAPVEAVKGKTYPLVFMGRDGKPESAWEPQGAAADLDRWERKAIKAVKAGRKATVPFTSAAIPESEQERIRAALAQARDVAAVKAAFAEDTDALIDQEWDEALMWAKGASEG
jgi:HK97 family phage portal protein